MSFVNNETKIIKISVFLVSLVLLKIIYPGSLIQVT